MSGVPTKMTLSADNSKLFFLDTNYNQSLNYIDISQGTLLSRAFCMHNSHVC